MYVPRAKITDKNPKICRKYTEFKNFNFNCTSRFADGQKPKIYFFIEKSRKNVVLSINQTISKLLKNKKNKGEWYLAT